jgi:hypothetical protein
MTSISVLPFTLLLVFASTTSSDQHFCIFVTLYTLLPHQDWRRAEKVDNRFARDEKDRETQLGETITRRAAS